MNIRKYSANKIKEYRKAAGLTQKELGEKVGVKHNTISGYENGTTEPEQSILFKIAAALHISINDLFPENTHPISAQPNTNQPKKRVAFALHRLAQNINDGKINLNNVQEQLIINTIKVVDPEEDYPDDENLD